jgi:hypothetical protein
MAGEDAGVTGLAAIDGEPRVSRMPVADITILAILSVLTFSF